MQLMKKGALLWMKRSHELLCVQQEWSNANTVMTMAESIRVKGNSYKRKRLASFKV